MKLVTIRDAKAHLNELIALAEKGEDVVLMRGSRHVATIRPFSGEDLELAPRLTDPQAERFWKRVAEDEKEGRFESFRSFEAAVRTLRRRLKTPAAS
ncbi:MAG: antitoxin [Planctomycetes bacterium]|nr:antitoxin [Planctomycetota bacterium]